MSIAELPTQAEARSMTFEDFLALPDDGVRRELIRGELRERGMTVRNRHHSRIEAIIAKILGNWLDMTAKPRGEVVCGEAGFRLRGTKESGVGIDVAYVSAELAAATPQDQAIYDGPPVLAVEILSPSDTLKDIVEKVGVYGQAGVVVWVVNPDFKTVAVHQPGAEPITLNVHDELSGEPYLPGFRARVADFFA